MREKHSLKNKKATDHLYWTNKYLNGYFIHFINTYYNLLPRRRKICLLMLRKRVPDLWTNKSNNKLKYIF